VKPYSLLAANFTMLDENGASENKPVLVFVLSDANEQMIGLDKFVSNNKNWYLAKTKLNLREKEYYISDDDMHPNKRAHIIFSDEIFDELKKEHLIPNSNS
jgi:hypothetical protein